MYWVSDSIQIISLLSYNQTGVFIHSNPTCRLTNAWIACWASGLSGKALAKAFFIPLWPLMILAGTLETFQCEGIPRPCLSWLRRVTGQGQGMYIEQRVQQRLNYLCGSTEARALHRDHLEAATCIKNGNKAIVHSWTHSLHFTNTLDYWLLGVRPEKCFGRGEQKPRQFCPSQSALGGTSNSGHHLWAPASVTSHLVVPSLTGCSHHISNSNHSFSITLWQVFLALLSSRT